MGFDAPVGSAGNVPFQACTSDPCTNIGNFFRKPGGTPTSVGDAGAGQIRLRTGFGPGQHWRLNWRLSNAGTEGCRVTFLPLEPTSRLLKRPARRLYSLPPGGEPMRPNAAKAAEQGRIP
jgi:hypothetical protein